MTDELEKFRIQKETQIASYPENKALVDAANHFIVESNKAQKHAGIFLHNFASFFALCSKCLKSEFGLFNFKTLKVSVIQTLLSGFKTYFDQICV